MSYILFGGLFDPPHLGHLEIADSAYNKIKPEQLIWIPSRYPPHRKVDGLDGRKRYDMLKWRFKNNDRFTVSDIELDKQHSGYSIETIQRFKNKFKSGKIYFLIGSDEAENFKKWKDWKKIIEKTTIIIGRRKKKINIPDRLKNNAVILENKIKNISSSEIRYKIRNNIEFKRYLDNGIYNYIISNNLYRN
ncbi:MAG: nicotinate (nicotinamide) nucleotide adenylyltransferase [Elusimicrobiota bacterium]